MVSLLRSNCKRGIGKFWCIATTSNEFVLCCTIFFLRCCLNMILLLCNDCIMHIIISWRRLIFRLCVMSVTSTAAYKHVILGLLCVFDVTDVECKSSSKTLTNSGTGKHKLLNSWSANNNSFHELGSLNVYSEVIKWPPISRSGQYDCPFCVMSNYTYGV